VIVDDEYLHGGLPLSNRAVADAVAARGVET